MNHKLMACCIFKDEALDMPAWVEYHKQIGFDHFMLYNNFSSDNYKERLQTYIDDGTVTVFEWPLACSQEKAYSHCVNKFKHTAEWIAFLDSDEYILPTGDVELYTHLSEHKNTIAGIAMNWAVFGSSGHVHRPAGLTIEEFTHRADKRFARNVTLK